MGKKPNYILIAICAAVGAAAPVILNNTVFSKDAKLDKGLMQAASQINESCPIMVDNVTRLDNAVAMPGKRIVYNYTLLMELPADFDKRAFESKVKPILINNYKNIPECQPMFKNGVTVLCRYKNKDGKHLIDIPITPTDCGY